MMTNEHLTEERLVAHYYADEAAQERAQSEDHLRTCTACSARLGALRAFLGAVEAPEVPERSEQYGAEVWGRLRGTWRRSASASKNGVSSASCRRAGHSAARWLRCWWRHSCSGASFSRTPRDRE